MAPVLLPQCQCHVSRWGHARQCCLQIPSELHEADGLECECTVLEDLKSVLQGAVPRALGRLAAREPPTAHRPTATARHRVRPGWRWHGERRQSGTGEKAVRDRHAGGDHAAAPGVLEQVATAFQIVDRGCVWTLDSFCMLQLYRFELLVLHNAPTIRRDALYIKIQPPSCQFGFLSSLRPPNPLDCPPRHPLPRPRTSMQRCRPGRPRCPPARRSSGNGAAGAGRCRRAAACRSSRAPASSRRTQRRCR